MDNICDCQKVPKVHIYKNSDHKHPSSVDRRRELGSIYMHPFPHGSVKVAVEDILGIKSISDDGCKKLPKIDDVHYRLIYSLEDVRSVLARDVFMIVVMRSYNDSMMFWRQQSPRQNIMAIRASVIVGYNDDDKWLILRPQFGEHWGDSGYCYYPYTDWGSHIYCVTVETDDKLNGDIDSCGCI